MNRIARVFSHVCSSLHFRCRWKSSWYFSEDQFRHKMKGIITEINCIKCDMNIIISHFKCSHFSFFNVPFNLLENMMETLFLAKSICIWWCYQFSDWFGSKRHSVWLQISWKISYVILCNSVILFFLMFYLEN